MLFKKLSAPSLKELFVAELEGMILSGKLEIGAKLPPERELAESMQVSRAVVNSGLDEMEKKGFLVVKPRIGTFVADYRKYGTADTLVSIMQYNGGRVNFGLYRSSDGKIVHVDGCMMEDAELQSVCRTVRRLVDKYKLTVYDGRRGLVRHVMARKGFATGEILCAIVTTDGKFDCAAELAEELAKRIPAVKSVSRIINDTKTPLWMGGEEYVLYGKGYITDELCGCSFEVSAKSFYQINPIQTEKLYNTAVEMAEITEKSRIVDAYCGIGTVGIIAAKKKNCSPKRRRTSPPSPAAA